MVRMDRLQVFSCLTALVLIVIFVLCQINKTSTKSTDGYYYIPPTDKCYQHADKTFKKCVCEDDRYDLNTCLDNRLLGIWDCDKYR